MNPFDILDQTFPSEPSPEECHWSNFQQEIFQWVADMPEQNLLIQARAGSGKTTTIIKAMDYAEGSSLFMAFNKAIADDIRQKARSGDVKTLNALGHQLWKENRRGVDLDPQKNRKLLARFLSSDDQSDYGFALNRAIGLAKNNALGITRPASVLDFEDLFDSYDLNIPRELFPKLSEAVLKAFIAGASDLDSFDFDDQLYMPLLQHWTFPRYGNVFVDETQDMSPVQHLMCDELHQQGARLVCVGDSRQAIYGFRGALSNSMELLKQRFQMVELPLSISYRCSLAVIHEAQKLCPQIEARSGAPEGRLLHTGEGLDIESDPELFPNSLVMCRNNAPMFRAILRHVRAKSPCRVLTNFLDSFQGFIRAFKCETTQALRIKLDKWYEAERKLAEEKNFRGKLMALEDKYETTKILCEDYRTTWEVLEMVKGLAKGISGPTFATIHKAKGLEHDNAFLLRPDLIPSKYSTTPEQLTQEENLLYVAITRAKHSFTFGERWS